MTAELVKESGITLSIDDMRWRENLILKEEVIKRQAQEALLNIAKEAEEMMQSFSDREGVDLRKYEINWSTGEARLPKKKGKKNGKAKSAS